MSATDLKDDITSNAQGPAEARGDSGSIRQHGLADQIAADKYLAGKDALADSSKKTFGVRFGRLIPPGAV